MFRSRYLIFLATFLAGCHFSVPNIVSPYKIDIQQGNYVTQDMVAKLKPGMSRSQVRFALGTPLVTDPFHPDRWDYVYVLEKKGQLIEQRRIVVVFKNEQLVRIEGDVVPAREAESAPADTKGAEKSAASKPVEGSPASKPAEDSATSKPAQGSTENKPSEQSIDTQSRDKPSESKPADLPASVTQ
jgi:outer membrane protein assembly factor BamE